MGSPTRMSVLTDVKSRLTGLARSQKARYSGGEERPLGGYGLTTKDIVLSAAATHKLS